jgi:hypothetical protein
LKDMLYGASFMLNYQKRKKRRMFFIFFENFI